MRRFSRRNFAYKWRMENGGGNGDTAFWVRRARKALAVPPEVARTVADFSTDPDVIYRWRDEMADLIEESGH